MLYFDPVLKKIVYDKPFGTLTPPPPVGSFTVPPYFGAIVNRNKAKELQQGEFADITQTTVEPLHNEDYSEISQQLRNGQTIMCEQVPLLIKRKNDSGGWFEFPIEPLISLSLKNIITRRYVAKSDRRGSIKERWSMDDFDISISGVLKNENGDDLFPEEKVKRLLEIVQSPNEIEVMSVFFQYFNITRMAVESVNFPHTKGWENQNFEIKGYSDYSYQLLIEK